MDITLAVKVLIANGDFVLFIGFYGDKYSFNN